MERTDSAQDDQARSDEHSGGDLNGVDGPATPASVLETALYASNLDACALFYKDVVGLNEVQRVEGRHVFLRCEQGMVMLFNPDATEDSGGGKFPVPPHGARGEGHICFRAAQGDMPGWSGHLKTRGVAIEADFEWPNGVRSIYVRDPAGNSVEFAEARLWGFDT